jgi:hypothetical protein
MVGNTFNIIILALATLIRVGVIWADFLASM